MRPARPRRCSRGSRTSVATRRGSTSSRELNRTTGPGTSTSTVARPGAWTCGGVSGRWPGPSGSAWCARCTSRRAWSCSSGRSVTGGRTRRGCCGPRSPRSTPRPTASRGAGSRCTCTTAVGCGVRCSNGCSVTRSSARGPAWSARSTATVPGADRYGARWDGSGTEVRVRAPSVERVELCGLDGDGSEWRADLERGDGGWWSARTERLGPGDRYGFRAHGPQHNPNRLLLDAAARAVAGAIDWGAARFDDPGWDSAPAVPWSVLVDPSFDWIGDRRPRVTAGETVVYEANV